MRRKLAIGAAGLVVLGGGGAAYAVNKANDNPRQAFLGDVAKRLNVTPQKLNDAIKERIESYRKENGLKDNAPVPADAVTASGSGLDPHISPLNAELQVLRKLVA